MVITMMSVAPAASAAAAATVSPESRRRAGRSAPLIRFDGFVTATSAAAAAAAIRLEWKWKGRRTANVRAGKATWGKSPSAATALERQPDSLYCMPVASVPDNMTSDATRVNKLIKSGDGAMWRLSPPLSLSLALNRRPLLE